MFIIISLPEINTYWLWYTLLAMFLRRHPSFKSWNVLTLGCRSLLPLCARISYSLPYQSPKNHRWRRAVWIWRHHVPSPSAVVFLHSDWLLMMQCVEYCNVIGCWRLLYEKPHSIRLGHCFIQCSQGYTAVLDILLWRVVKSVSGSLYRNSFFWNFFLHITLE